VTQKIIRQFSLRFGLVILLANFSAGWMIANPALAAEFDIAVIADTNTAIPGGSGYFTSLLSSASPSVDGGDVAFNGTGSSQEGIYADIGGLGVVADRNTAIPGGSGYFTIFVSPNLDSGNVVFLGQGSSGQVGIYTDIGSLGVIADTNTAIPAGLGYFTGFGWRPRLDGGNVAFQGKGSGGQDGIYTDIGGLGVIADTNTAIPAGSGYFTGFENPSLDSGNVAFRAYGSGAQTGIYTDIGGLGVIADTNTAIPAGSGYFTGFWSPSLKGGNVAFGGRGSGGQDGIYADIEGLGVIADTNTAIPAGTGYFTEFSVHPPGLDGGNVAFWGTGSGGQSGIYADIKGLVVVADTNTPIPAGSGRFTDFDDAISFDDGNVAFLGFGSGGQMGIYVAFLVHHWSSGASGSWDDETNWLFSTFPRDVVPTAIHPVHSVNVVGPSGFTTIRSLTLGSQTTGVATLDLTGGGTLTVDQSTVITARGKLTGDGIINALGGIGNAGEIDLGTASLQIAGGTITNSGLISGNGSIDNALVNTTDGELYVGPGQRMKFTGTNGHVNSGQIEVIGGEVRFKAGLTNNPTTGLITGRAVTLHFGSGLTNNGSLALTTGVSDIFGDVTNGAGSQVVVSGGSTVTFYGDVTNDPGSTFQVSAAGTLTSTAVFFGSLTGTGVSGTGNVFMEGDMRPGASPGVMDFGGNLSLGPLSTTQIELAGSTPGTGHDQVAVAGGLSLGGELDLVHLAPYTDPAARGTADTFVIIDASVRNGNFSTVQYNGSALAADFGPDGNGSFRSHQGSGMFRNISYTSTTVELQNLLSLEGDVDGDKDVDITDFNSLATNFDPDGATAPHSWLEGNFDGDNDTDITDFNRLAANYIPAGYATSAIPEPSTMLLASLALILVGVSFRLSKNG